MKIMILKTLKPSALTWFLMILLILVQFLFCSSTILNEPPLSTSQYGIGSPIEILYIDAARQDARVDIDWIVLIVNLITCYLLSAMTVALMKKVTGLQKPFPVYGGTVLGIACIAFLVSIIFSKSYWGYFLHRPAVLAELKDVTQVITIVPVTTEQTPTGEYRFVVNTDFSIADQIAYVRKYPYYNLDERILVYLNEKHLLPEETATSLASYTDFYSLLPETGLLAKAQDGYTSARLFTGVIVEARNTSGSKLVFLSVTGQQVSNDHYPCYEMVFEKHPQSGQLAFVHGQRFFFDVAGLEGLEWFSVWLVISLIGTIFVFPVVTIIAGIRNMVRSKEATVQVGLNA